MLGHANVIGAHVKRQHLSRELGGHNRLQILEFHLGRFEDLGVEVQTRKLFHAFGCAAHPLPKGHAVGPGEAVFLGGHAHLFHLGQAGAGDVQQGVLLAGVHGEMKLASHGGIDKFQDDVRPNTVDVTISPLLEGKGGSLAAPLLLGPHVGAAAGVRVVFVRGTVHDVNPPAITLPTGNAGSVVLVGVSDAAVIFLFELVLRTARAGVPPLPESLDELLALFIGRELFEGRPLFVRYDVGDFFGDPLLVGGLHFLLDRLLPALLLLTHLLRVLALFFGR